MPKKTTQNDYLTKEDLVPYATKEDLGIALAKLSVNLKDEIVGEVRGMFNELTKVMNDNFSLIYKELHETKLTQVEHTRQIDQSTLDIEDLQQDVGLLQTLNTI